MPLKLTQGANVKTIELYTAALTSPANDGVGLVFKKDGLTWRAGKTTATTGVGYNARSGMKVGNTFVLLYGRRLTTSRTTNGTSTIDSKYVSFGASLDFSVQGGGSSGQSGASGGGGAAALDCASWVPQGLALRGGTGGGGGDRGKAGSTASSTDVGLVGAGSSIELTLGTGGVSTSSPVGGAGSAVFGDYGVSTAASRGEYSLNNNIGTSGTIKVGTTTVLTGERGTGNQVDWTYTAGSTSSIGSGWSLASATGGGAYKAANHGGGLARAGNNRVSESVSGGAGGAGTAATGNSGAGGNGGGGGYASFSWIHHSSGVNNLGISSGVSGSAGSAGGAGAGSISVIYWVKA
jgi:hypothetical protein